MRIANGEHVSGRMTPPEKGKKSILLEGKGEVESIKGIFVRGNLLWGWNQKNKRSEMC